jgi:transposase
MKDWLPPDHPVWVVIDAVASMDLSPFYQNYREDGWGAAAFQPGMMVALLLYGYSRGIRSSRKIAQACREDIAFRVITANHPPDHATIARFRQGNVTHLEALFREVLRVCRKAGMIRLGVFSLDGTKLKANASLDGNRTADQLKEEQKQLQEEQKQLKEEQKQLQDQEEQQRIRQEIAGQIEETLADAERLDREENARYGPRQRGDELPPELRDPATRQTRLEECLRRLQEEAQEEAAQQARKIEDRQAEEEATGKKKRGRKPKNPDPDPSPQAKARIDRRSTPPTRTAAS